MSRNLKNAFPGQPLDKTQNLFFSSYVVKRQKSNSQNYIHMVTTAGQLLKNQTCLVHKAIIAVMYRHNSKICSKDLCFAKGPLAELFRWLQQHSSSPGFNSPWERISSKAAEVKKIPSSGRLQREMSASTLSSTEGSPCDCSDIYDIRFVLQLLSPSEPINAEPGDRHTCFK